jgi:succinate dehydrogenase/fumarate reductase flavoprotein subunit
MTVTATSLLTEKGVQGAKVIGATGVNGRTGEFVIFRAKPPFSVRLPADLSGF